MKSVCGKINNFPCVLKYQRNNYAKKIRKQYELGNIKEKRCNMREYTFRVDGMANTLTTVQKDNYVVIPCAMRGRYDKSNNINQQLVMREDGSTNTITCVMKDKLIIERGVEI